MHFFQARPSLRLHLDSNHQLVEMPSAAPRGDDLDANYVDEEYDVQLVGAQNHADTMFRVATSMLSRSLSPLKTMARMWKALGCSLP